MRWLTPVIPTLQKAKLGGLHKARSLRSARPIRKNLVTTKNTKLAGHGGAFLYSQLLRRLKQENLWNPGCGGCCEPRTHHCTPAWATRAKLCLKKKKRKYLVNSIGVIKILTVA